MRKTACVTGGSGYIASALIKVLLEKGYAVKTTVRNNPDDTEKNSHLKDLQALGPLEVFRADLDEEGSFDKALVGCDYAFLVATPADPHPNDPEKAVMEAAARGALNVMRSCLRAGTVKRVVLTSSASAVYSRPLQGDGRHVLLEDSWADVDFLTANKQPADWAYTVSMVLMEKEACRFAKEHGIDLVTVCPVATVVGKAPAAAARKIPAAFLSLISGDEAAFSALKRIEMETGGCLPLVHIDDVCGAEVFVAEEGAAAGRYICCSINATIICLARYLEQQCPQYTIRTELISGSDGELLVMPRVCLSSAKLVSEGFDFKYNIPEEIYDDMIDYGKAIGILPSSLLN